MNASNTKLYLQLPCNKNSYSCSLLVNKDKEADGEKLRINMGKKKKLQHALDHTQFVNTNKAVKSIQLRSYQRGVIDAQHRIQMKERHYLQLLSHIVDAHFCTEA